MSQVLQRNTSLCAVQDCPRERPYWLDDGLIEGRKESSLTNIYHVSYTPGAKEASLFFWGCNFDCKGCLSKKEIHNYLLKENLHLFNEEPSETARPPERFLSADDVIRILGDLDVTTVLFEGQEAALDSLYPYLTAALHERFGTQNILCTNLYRMPALRDTDWVQMSIKAFDDGLHRDYTGKSNERVLRNFESLCRAGVRLSVATVLIPGYIDTDEIDRVAKYIAGVDKNVPYNILPYFKSGDNPWRRPTPNEMHEAEVIARRHLNRVHAWRGDEELKFEVVRVY